MSSEIHPKNIIMTMLEEVSKEARRAFEAHHKASEEYGKAIEARELQEFLTCLKKNRQGKITQVKDVVLPSTSGTTEVTHNVSISTPSVTHEFVYDMLIDYYKNMENQMQQMIEERIDKFVRNLDISYDSPTAHVNQHALNSSAIHLPLESTQFNTSLNYFPSQAPSARDTFLDIEVPKSGTVLNLPMVQQTSMISTPNDYFVRTINSHVDVATYSDSVLVASASNYSDVLVHACHNSEYVQKLMSTMHSGISNIQHAPAYSHSSVIERIHMPMNNYHDQTNIIYLESFHETSYASGPNNF
jgi:hypothetical protein